MNLYNNFPLKLQLSPKEVSIVFFLNREAGLQRTKDRAAIPNHGPVIHIFRDVHKC
jgi:hypothetical protein